jgi:hypothetical protein
MQISNITETITFLHAVSFNKQRLIAYQKAEISAIKNKSQIHHTVHQRRTHSGNLVI